MCEKVIAIAPVRSRCVTGTMHEVEEHDHVDDFLRSGTCNTEEV